MFCPICKNIKLEEIKKGDIFLYKCSKCDGIALKNVDLEKIIIMTQKIVKKIKIKDDVDVMKYSKQKEPMAKCPSCKYNLYTIKNKDLELDYCLNCRIFWFDSGELSSLIENYKNGRIMLLESSDSTKDSTINLIFSLLR